MRVGMGQITIQNSVGQQNAQKQACQAAGSQWVTDPNPNLSPEEIAAGMQPGMCVPAGVNPASVQFAHLTGPVPPPPATTALAAAAPALATPPTMIAPSTTSLPPQVINGPMPSVVTPPARSIFVPALECRSFDVAVNNNKAFAALALIGIFAIFGGFR